MYSLLAEIDAWVETVMTCLTERDTPVDKRQMVYACTHGMILELPIAQLTGHVRVIVQYWAGDEVASGTSGAMTNAVEVLSTMKRYLCVDCQWFGEYVSIKMATVWDCYIAR